MRSIGIDIGRYSIKVVEVLAANRSYQITNAKEYKILNPQTNDLEVDIMQTLAKIAKEFDTDSAKTICSVRQQYVSTRKLFFPFKERNKIQKSLAFELEDDIPLSIDKALYDSKIIKYHDKSAEVIAMACVTEEVERTVDIFNRGHVDPDIVAPEMAGIANLYESWYKSPEEVKEDQEGASYQPDKMIVHIGHSKTFVGVISRQNLIWGRSIMWGAEKVAQSISQSFSVPFMTALDMMPNKAFVLLTSGDANKDQIKMSDSVTKAVDQLIQSLRLSKMLANTEYGANIESIELIGGAGEIKNLSAYFTQELEKPTNVVNPMHNLNPAYMANHDKLNPVFLLSLGLAIEGLRRPVNPPVNFRQDELAKKNQSFEKIWEKWGYTTKILGIAWASYLVYGIMLSGLATNLSEVASDSLQKQASKIANVKGGAVQSKVRSYIRRNNKKAKLVKVYDEISEINSPIKWINDVSQILPSNKDKSYEVRHFTVKNDQVKIQGVANTSDTIKKIEKALKGVSADGEVTKLTKALIKDEENRTTFAYKFKIKRKN